MTAPRLRFLFGNLRHHHRKLVASKTEANIVRGASGTQPLGNLLQKIVSIGVTEAIVDCLEPIEIDADNRQRPLRRQLRKPGRYQCSVGKPREEIMCCRMPHVLFRIDKHPERLTRRRDCEDTARDEDAECGRGKGQ